MAEEQFACPQFACQNSSLPFLLPTIKKNVTTKAQRSLRQAFVLLRVFVPLWSTPSDEQQWRRA